MSSSVQANPEQGVRPMRADARRNYDQLVAAAAELFDERGIDAPLEEIARRAGVGIGTLYRHLPNRDAVIEAVYRREVDLLTGNVDELLQNNTADVALATWMRSFARYVARKRGMADALKSMMAGNSEMFADTRVRITGSIETLVAAAAASGTIRSDVDPADLLRALSGICMASEDATSSRIVDLLMDGLRYGAISPAGSAN